MGDPSLLARSGLWRLTRHPLARACYRRCKRRGWFLAQLDRFERSTAPPDQSAGEPLVEVTFDVVPATDQPVPALEDTVLAPSDRIVLATRGDRTVGWCCLSDRPVYVPELERRLRFPGAYCWRVFVTPRDRGAGIGTAILRVAVEHSRTTLETDRITALVAPDNLPSRRAFQRLGFAPRERYTSWGCFGRRWHRRRGID